MENKSRVNTILLVIIIILLVIGLGYIIFNNLEKEKEDVEINSLPQESQSNNIGWQIAQGQENQVFYKDSWKATREQDGYLFELPSGNFINWKFTGQICVEDKASFIYGVSDGVCIHGWMAWMGVKNVRVGNSKEDFNAFGDFVLKNQ